MIDPVNQPTHPDESSPTVIRVALAHDWLVGRRGGELVLDAIVNALLDDQYTITNLYTMFDTGAPITPAIDAIEKTVSPLNKYPPSLRRWLLFRYPGAVEKLTDQLAKHHNNAPIDLLISSHSAAIKALSPPSPSVPHLCYCHTPARYLWSQRGLYASPGFKGRLRSSGLKLATPTLRRWDRAAADSVTHFIANSTHTAEQINQHYHRDSIIIHPPVRTDFFVQSDAPRTDELLLVSALEPYKRVELAIDAAAIANRPLNIVGTGSHDSQLRKHARRARSRFGSRSLIQFLGHRTDKQLLAHYQSASAFLFPQIEDFGITAVEAQATGCPVVARRAGGALDTIIEDSTGVLFDETTPESIADAIARVPTHTDTPEQCRNSALRFSESLFQEKFRSLLNSILNQHRC
jgi:glycosyltransferase involved in cell wall biosynthesis